MLNLFFNILKEGDKMNKEEIIRIAVIILVFISFIAAIGYWASYDYFMKDIDRRIKEKNKRKH